MINFFIGSGWSAPILINFVRQDARDAHQYLPHPPGEVIHDRDSLGNSACSTLFVKNFVPTITQERIRGLFPTAIKILAGTKELRPGEFRTAYITFDSIPAAVAARHHVNGFTDADQQKPLVVNYSVRPHDQPKQSHTPAMGSHTGIPYGMGGIGGMGNMGFGMSDYTFPLNYIHSRGFGAPFMDFGPGFRGFGGNRANFPTSMPSMSALGEALPGFAVVVDSKGNPATNTLFVDCLPYDVKESTLKSIFSNTTGFRGLQMGNKVLQSNEYRTAVVYYNVVENAVRARGQLQYHKEPGWSRPLIIRYVKH